jgi:hypothetical protein
MNNGNANLNPRLRPQELERFTRPALERAVEGTGQGTERIALRYCIRRVRPLDADNAAGATKTLTDLLCRIGLLPGDDPTKISLQVEQEKVRHYHEEQTQITIVYP